MDRRQFITVAAGLGASTLWPAGAFAQGKPEISALTIGFGLDPVFAPHIIAMEKGWLRDAGFTQVDTKSFAGGALAGEALIAGEIQLWTPGNLPPISMAHTGIPVVVLGTNCLAAAAEKLVVRKSANVKAPEDLYGVRIGLLAGSTASATLYNLAKHYGLDEKRLQVVNMPPPEQLAGLNSGSIDGLLCWEPWGTKALESDANELIHSGTESGFAQNKGQPVKISATRSLFVASQDFVRRNPNATRALMEVLVRGQRFVADPKNKSEILPLVAEKTKQDLALVQSIWDEYVFDPAFDEAYVRDMQSLTDYLVASGRIKDPRHPLDYTFTGPVASVDPSLVKVPGRWTP